MKKRISLYKQVALLPMIVLLSATSAFADDHDPILSGPLPDGFVEGIGVGSLISTAIMGTAKISEDSGGVVIWGYRKNGHSGNYNYNGKNVGFEHNSAADRRQFPRLETVQDFNKLSELRNKTIKRIVTTAHTIAVITEDGEVWSWGDSLHGTAGCINTGYETGVNDSNRFTDYAVVYNTYTRVDGTRVRSSHYQARPCPTFGRKNPNPEFHKKVTYMDAGEYNFIALIDDGVNSQVYTWGSDAYSQTVRAGTYQGAYGPVVVPSGDKGEPVNITGLFEGEKPVLVGGGYEGQYAVTEHKQTKKRTLWGWGRSFGCGLTTRTSPIDRPMRMTEYDQYAEGIKYVNGGYGWTGVLLKDGRVIVNGLDRHIGFDTGPGASGDSKYSCTPRVLMGAGTNYPPVDKLIVRYAGGVAIPRGDSNAVYTWGGTPAGGAYFQVYGTKPIRRQLAGDLAALGATKEAIYYTTKDGALYGVGYGDQRVTNLCDNYTISWDRNRGKFVNKNSMNWYSKTPDGALKPGGYRIPYEERIDVVGVDYCDGRFTSGFYAGQDRDKVRRWTGYDDGRDGNVPSDSGALTCQNDNC